MIVSNAIAGVWCLGANWLPKLRVKAMWWFVVAAEVTCFLQAIFGVIVINTEKLEAPKFHMLYGFSAIVAVGIMVSYRQQIKQYQYLLYGLGGLFIMGLGIRAVYLDPLTTGR